ncbi:MAG TPA: CvpA family protein [Roseiarcus sp.]|nr:CvpA family protein [Roseiarcus sp.]
MPSYLDLGVIVIVLISAFLSMVRGFTREVLAIGSWVAAAAAAYFFYPYLMPYATPYIHKEIIAQAVCAAAVFFVTLVVVSTFTVRISDAILDSKIGALDRSLGFLFGVARGFLLAVVAFAIFNWLVADKQQPQWVKDAKTRPILTATADRVIAMLPEDAEHTIENWLKSGKGAVAPDQAPPPDEQQGTNPSGAAPGTSPAAPAPAGSTPQKKTDASPDASSKQKLEAIINGKSGATKQN